jgi:hypothetical protein
MTFKNAVAIASSLIALFIFSACSGGSSTIVKPAVTFLGISLSKSVKKQGDVGVPVEPTSSFSTNDKEAVALVAIKNLHYQIRLRWEWYSPDGNLYHTTGNVPVNISTKKYVRKFSAWHALTIKGDKAGDLPGAWSVKVYMDDEYLDVKRFDIIKSNKS